MLTGFVTFEGIDGSGKTTVSRLVAEALRKRGETVFLTGEPTRGWTGDAVRHAYRDDIGPLAEAFLFLADRAAHQEEIRIHLGRGELVLCDRYADSTYAYQGARLEGVVADPVLFLRRITEPWLLTPDLTIFLRVPAETGLQRIADRPDKIRFEELSFLKKVAANYDALATDTRFATIDGRPLLATVVKDAVDIIDKRLKARPRVALK